MRNVHSALKIWGRPTKQTCFFWHSELSLLCPLRTLGVCDGSLSTETSIAIYRNCYQRSEINSLKLKEEVRGASQSVASEVKKIKL